ncbi:hypothetical protein BPTFM16_02519 [Altererythrobacter insulae]|nr:hypothetical protein BPTFM16_02519 [Altererythrobacter insulae]
MIAFALCTLTAFGGRAQLLIAELGRTLGRKIGLLAIAALTALLTTAMMAILGAMFAEPLVGSQRQLLIVGAFLLAALELALPVKSPRLVEPTRSLGAIALVLFARQIVDAPRLCALASAAALADPDHALVGGGLAALFFSALAWFFCHREFPQTTRNVVRWGLSATLIALGLFIGSIVQ